MAKESVNVTQETTSPMSFCASRKYRPVAGAAFTLIELLAVMAVITVMAVLSVPAFSSISSSGRTNQAVVEIAGLLENARQYAVSKNTYVWVAFAKEESATDGGVLMVAVVASKDGMKHEASGSVPGGDFNQVSQVKVFPQLAWEDAGKYGGLEGMAASQQTGSANNVAGSGFKLKVPGRTGTMTFTQAVEFQPTGEARNSGSPIDVLEFAVLPKKPKVDADSGGVAVFRVNGLTGQTRIYRR